MYLQTTSKQQPVFITESQGGTGQKQNVYHSHSLLYERGAVKWDFEPHERTNAGNLPGSENFLRGGDNQGMLYYARYDPALYWWGLNSPTP